MTRRRERIASRLGGWRFLLLAILGLAAGRAPAQELPGTVAPGLLQRQFQPPPALPRPSAPLEILPLPAPAPRPAVLQTIKFRLANVEIAGATVFSPAELRPLFADLVGKEVSLDRIYQLADDIAIHYRKAGYILSQALVPPQRIGGGIVKIQVVEGYIARVRFEGTIAGARSIIEGYGTSITQDRPIRLGTLERYLLLMNDLPGVTAQATLAPSATETGAADLVVALQNREFGASSSLDNRGTKFLGPYEGSLAVTANSLLGAYDQLDARFIGTTNINEERYGEIRYAQPIGDGGLRSELAASILPTKPGFTLAQSEIKGEDTALSLDLSYPLLRSRSENLTIGGGIKLEHSTTDELGERIADDALRILSARTQFDVADRWQGANLIFAELKQGIDGLGASSPGSPQLSVAGGRPDFTLTHATVQRQQDLAGLMPRLSVLVAADGQYAFSKLLVPVQYAYGGEPFGRAYDPAEITGDHGAAAKAELQYTLDGIPGSVGAVQLYTYYDFGYVWRIAPTGGLARTAAGASGGFGVRMLVDRFTFYLEMAKPLTRGVAADGGDGKDARLFFRIAASY